MAPTAASDLWSWAILTLKLVDARELYGKLFNLGGEEGMRPIGRKRLVVVMGIDLSSSEAHA